MKQIIQSYRDGKIELTEVPYPACQAGNVLVRNHHSVVSIGTERSMIELGRKSLMGKAKSRPDLVKRFMEKARNEGLLNTFNSAMRRLNDAIPLGYSSAGQVVEIGTNIQHIAPGDYVACIGGGVASHSEFVTVPSNLCVKISEGVSTESAAFCMLGIIAMHAVRCAELLPGERVAVVGLGLLGLIQVQILRAYGYQVVATDLNESKRKLCKQLGIKDCVPPGKPFIEACQKLSGGMGMDAVILGVATKSDKPIHDAVKIARFRGHIVLMGVADVHPHRNEMWDKEVSFVVSKAGGPGIGDENYEVKGIDYPSAYVRWTEKRNLEEFLRLLESGKVKIEPLITHRSPFQDALALYEELLSEKGSSAIGVVLEYPEDGNRERTVYLKPQAPPVEGPVNLGVIGGGLFAKTTMLPALGKIEDVSFNTICTSRGLTANHIGKQHGFNRCTTDISDVINTPEVNSVIILTQHKDHSDMVLRSLEAKKHTFVEKPLCVTHKQLENIIQAYEKLETRLILMVGYNRRFSPLATQINEFFQDRVHPIIAHYRVNAGYVPPDHWIYAPENGNGRIIGEVCHMVDFMMFLTGNRPVRVSAERAGETRDDYIPNDNVIINIKFTDGSIGNITYSADGDRSLPRERMEAYCDGKVAILDDFRYLELYTKGRKKRVKFSNQNMGYQEEMQHFIDLVKGNAEPKLTPEEIFYSTKAVFCIHDSIEKGASQIIEL